MRVAIFDADLIGRKKHRFPNLACMKISSYHKSLGDEVELETKWPMIPMYDRVYVSKVFTDTPVDEYYLNQPNVTRGGTGFYFDKAPSLPQEIEHCMPDYHLYDEWLRWVKKNGATMKMYEVFTDHSLGFLTRGCSRHCPFCVNKVYKRVMFHSHLSEFLDPARKIVTLLDDNFLGYHGWKTLWKELEDSNRYFVFNQGLDARLLNDEKCETIFSTKKYYRDYRFAFDNIEDTPIITKKLQLIRKHTKKGNIKFYLFTGMDKNGVYDDDFWRRDLADLFTRAKILARYDMKPYMMRFNAVYESRFARFYQFLCMWMNQPRMYTYLSLDEFNETMKKTHSVDNINSKDYESLRSFLPEGAATLHMRDLIEFGANKRTDKELDETPEDDDM